MVLCRTCMSHLSLTCVLCKRQCRCVSGPPGWLSFFFFNILTWDGLSLCVFSKYVGRCLYRKGYIQVNNTPVGFFLPVSCVFVYFPQSIRTCRGWWKGCLRLLTHLALLESCTKCVLVWHFKKKKIEFYRLLLVERHIYLLDKHSKLSFYLISVLCLWT